MSNLFKIQQQYIDLANSIIDNGGEVTPEIETQLQITEAELQEKATSYGYVVKSLEYDCEVIDAEITRLNGLKKSRQSTIERMKNTVSEAMQNCGIFEVKSPTMKLSFLKSEKCEIYSEKQIPAIYKREVTTVKIDKAAIKKAIKAGETVAGARIQENQNLQIK